MDFYIKLTVIILIVSVLIRGTGAIIIKKTDLSVKISVKDFYLFITFMIFYLLSVLRNITVGRDTKFYRRVFSVLGSKSYSDYIPNSMQGYRGYRLLCRGIYLLFGDNYFAFNCIIFLIILIIIFNMIKKCSMDYYMSVLLFLLMYMLFNSWNYSRQYCAIAFGAGAVTLLKEKKYITSVLFVLLAISFHSTASILLVMYLLDWIKWTKMKFIIFSVMAFLGTMAFNPLVKLFLYLFPRFSYLYGKQFLSGDFSSHFGGIASGRRSLISVLFLLIIICTLYLAKNDSLNKLWFYMAMTMASIVIGIVFRHYSAILRMQEYFNVITIISIPNMIGTAVENKHVQTFVEVCLICIMLVPYYVQLSENYASIIPYQLFMD